MMKVDRPTPTTAIALLPHLTAILTEITIGEIEMNKIEEVMLHT